MGVLDDYRNQSSGFFEIDGHNFFTF